jgi:hypothetical protein
MTTLRAPQLAELSIEDQATLERIAKRMGQSSGARRTAASRPEPC